MKRLVKYGLGLGVLATFVAGATVAWAQQGLPNTLVLVEDNDGTGEPLFKSVLDALGEAVYVEPKALIGKRRTPFLGKTRDQLKEARDGAGYTSSTAPPLTATENTLSDVVTRAVTLEGQDVRTQERADEYAREVVRQRQLAPIIEKLCREAFGSDKCQLNQGELGDPKAVVAIAQERERAYITDPLKFAQIPITNGALAVLDSGTKEYQEKAKQTLKDAEAGKQVVPLAYSSEIAEVRNILDPGSPAYQKFDKIVEAVKGIYRPKSFDTVALAENVQARAQSPLTEAEQDLQKNAQGLSQAIDVYDALQQISESAQARVAGELFATVVDNAIPDRAHIVQPGYQGTVQRDTYGEIKIVDTAPANVKVGLQQELLPLLAQAVANPKFVDPDQIQNQAGVSAVDQQGQQLKIGTPLESFEAADVIEQGLYYHSGITPAPGMHLGNFLQQKLPEILRNMKP